MAKVRVYKGNRKQIINDVNSDGSVTINRIGYGGTMDIAPSMWDKFGIFDLVKVEPAYDPATQYLVMESEGMNGGAWEQVYVAQDKPVEPVV